MLRSEATGQRPRAPPWREREWKESKELLLDAIERMHAFDEMRHWRDTERGLRTFRRWRPTLIDDNPCSG